MLYIEPKPPMETRDTFEPPWSRQSRMTSDNALSISKLPLVDLKTARGH